MIKVLLILALYTFAVHASLPVNATDYCLGFANGTNFTFTNVEVQNCIRCLQAIHPIDYQQLDEYNPFNSTTLRDGLYHAIYQKDRVWRNCKPFVSDLQAFFSANKTPEDLFKTIDANTKNYLTEFKISANLLKAKSALTYACSYDFGYYKAITLRYATGVLVPNTTSSQSSSLIHRDDGFLAF